MNAFVMLFVALAGAPNIGIEPRGLRLGRSTWLTPYARSGLHGYSSGFALAPSAGMSLHVGRVRAQAGLLYRGRQDFGKGYNSFGAGVRVSVSVLLT